MKHLLTTTGLALALLALGAAGPAHADGERRLRVPLIATYVEECGACHVPYPPGLLPAASWQRLMGGLDRHFGNDASVDPAALQEIGGWLARHAGSRRESPPQDRITRSAWFQDEHDDIGAATWSRASIKSASKCAACHPAAAQGRYDEHDIRIPR